MFFFLSKFLKFAITPLFWVILLLVIALRSHDQFERKKYLKWALIVLLVFSNPYIFNVLMGNWQVSPVSHKRLKTYEAGIVLGGVSSYDRVHDRIQFLRGADRLFQAIDLYKMGRIKKIVFTGGSGYVLHPEDKEGAMIKKYVLKLGIPSADFLVENESRNTYENAILTKVLLDQEHIHGNLLLITSAFHMRRSLACFNKANVFPEPFSADVYGDPIKNAPRFDLDKYIIPSVDLLLDWTNFIHEMIGYVVYKMVGYA